MQRFSDMLCLGGVDAERPDSQDHFLEGVGYYP